MSGFLELPISKPVSRHRRLNCYRKKWLLTPFFQECVPIRFCRTWIYLWYHWQSARLFSYFQTKGLYSLDLPHTWTITAVFSQANVVQAWILPQAVLASSSCGPYRLAVYSSLCSLHCSPCWAPLPVHRGMRSQKAPSSPSQTTVAHQAIGRKLRDQRTLFLVNNVVVVILYFYLCYLCLLF